MNNGCTQSFLYASASDAHKCKYYDKINFDIFLSGLLLLRA